MKISDQELLRTAVLNGMVDLGMLNRKMEEMAHEKYLKNHCFDIWQSKDGRWITYLPDKHKRRQISAVTRENLEKKIVAFYKQAETIITLDDVFNRWIVEKEQTDITKRTVDKYKYDYLRYFSIELRNAPIHDISEADLALYVKRTIKEQSLTVKAYSGMRILLTGIFKYAKVHDLTDISITSFFDSLEINKRTFKAPKRGDGTQIYTHDDLQALISALEAITGKYEAYALGILFVIRTGLRVGELIAIKSSDIEGNVLKVQRQHISYQKVHGERVHENVDYTKTMAGMRDVILTDKAKQVIDRIRLISKGKEFLFMTNDRQILDSDYNHFLQKICQQAGIQYRSIHKLRKTFATMLLDNNVDEIYVKKIMGHEDIQTTRKHYYYCSKTKSDYESQIKSAITI